MTLLSSKESFLLKNQSFVSIPRRLNDIARLYLLLAGNREIRSHRFRYPSVYCQ